MHKVVRDILAIYVKEEYSALNKFIEAREILKSDIISNLGKHHLQLCRGSPEDTEIHVARSTYKYNSIPLLYKQKTYFGNRL